MLCMGAVHNYHNDHWVKIPLSIVYLIEGLFAAAVGMSKGGYN